jgi:integrase
VHAPRSKKAAVTQAKPVSAEALHASANVFQNTMAMLLARNMPVVASQQPTPPPVELAPDPAPAPRQPRDRRLFADYSWEWFESYKVPKLRPGTEMNYRLIIRKHLVPFFGSMRLDEIPTVDVQRFYNQHAHQSRSTVNKLALILHGIFDSAIEDGLCVIDPTRSKRLTYSKKKTYREALAIEDAQDIIRNLGKLELKDRLLVALLIFTGIRRGEALGLQWEDIDFDRKLINIRRSVRFAGNKGYIGPTKSKAGVRLIPLEPQLEEILTALPHDGTYILGNGEFPITEMTYKRGWERICRTINMQGLRRMCSGTHISRWQQHTWTSRPCRPLPVTQISAPP